MIHHPGYSGFLPFAILLFFPPRSIRGDESVLSTSLIFSFSLLLFISYYLLRLLESYTKIKDSSFISSIYFPRSSTRYMASVESYVVATKICSIGHGRSGTSVWYTTGGKRAVGVGKTEADTWSRFTIRFVGCLMKLI